ncbi:MAG TPA: flavin reductase family protein [Ktedonobacteraceae bacterium]
MHQVIEPKILYMGTPVVLISTLNEDGSPNLAPMSSAWWLGWTCMLGLGKSSQTVLNLQRERECVLNLPSAELVAAVDRLALTTGRNPVPERRAKIGYRYEADKFGTALLSEEPSDLVKAPRVAECPVQLEAVIENVHDIGANDPRIGSCAAIEARIVRVHVDERLLIPGAPNYIDAEKWQPLIMSFCEFFGLSGILHPSKLAPAFYGAPKPTQTAPTV